MVSASGLVLRQLNFQTSDFKAIPASPPPRHDEAFVLEPEAAVFLQHVPRGVQVVAVGDGGVEAGVVDLGHVDGRVPGREEGFWVPGALQL